MCKQKHQKKKLNVWDLLYRFQHLDKLLRFTAHILRFLVIVLSKCKINARLKKLSFFNNKLIKNYFKLKTDHKFARADELTGSRLVWIGLVQKTFFKSEISSLSRG